MKYFADTHILLWAVSAPERLSPKQKRIIEDEQNEILFSAASIWELAIKVSLGKLHLLISETELVNQLTQGLGFQEVAIHSVTTITAAHLPYYHRDPFDRIIIAHCQNLNLPLLTADTLIPQYDLITIE